MLTSNLKYKLVNKLRDEMRTLAREALRADIAEIDLAVEIIVQTADDYLSGNNQLHTDAASYLDSEAFENLCSMLSVQAKNPRLLIKWARKDPVSVCNYLSRSAS